MYLKDAIRWYGFQFPLYDDTDAGVLEDDLKLEEETPEKEEDDNSDDLSDEEKDEEKDEDSSDEDSEETDKESEEEEPVEEDEEDDESKYTTFKDIKAKYPDFFKNFPDLRAALVRESKYSEYFGSPEEAEVAVSKSNALTAMEEDLLVKNDPRGLIDIVHKNSPEAVEKIVLNLLPYLAEKHRDLYYDMAAVPIKQLLRNAWSEGKGKETDLGKAAAIIHNFFFKNYNINEKVKGEGAKPEEKTSREKELEERLTKIEEGKFTDFVSSCDVSYASRMHSLISDRLEKDERLTPYMRNKLVEDVMVTIKKQLDNDSRYKGQMNTVLRQAKASGYSSDFKSRVLSTALARAKSLIPDVTKKVISDALKVNKSRSSNSEEKSTKLRFTPNETRNTKKSSGEPQKPKTDLDILRSA